MKIRYIKHFTGKVLTEEEYNSLNWFLRLFYYREIIFENTIATNYNKKKKVNKRKLKRKPDTLSVQSSSSVSHQQDNDAYVDLLVIDYVTRNEDSSLTISSEGITESNVDFSFGGGDFGGGGAGGSYDDSSDPSDCNTSDESDD